MSTAQVFSTMHRRQKAAEKFLVGEFLRNTLGMSVRRLLGRRDPHPDTYAVLETDGRTAVVEIELTEYHADTQGRRDGGSPGMALESFWCRVQKSLYRRLSRTPLKVHVRLTLGAPSVIRRTDPGAFAEELVRIARGFCVGQSGGASMTAFEPEFPLLRQHVRTLNLSNVSYTDSLWTCTNASAAHVALVPERVAGLIRRKQNKRYKWAKNAEKWLLVCASGASIVGTAGSPPATATWRDAELQAACKESPFDRVYFWERPCGWHERLK